MPVRAACNRCCMGHGMTSEPRQAEESPGVWFADWRGARSRIVAVTPLGLRTGLKKESPAGLVTDWSDRWWSLSCALDDSRRYPWRQGVSGELVQWAGSQTVEASPLMAADAVCLQVAVTAAMRCNQPEI